MKIQGHSKELKMIRNVRGFSSHSRITFLSPEATTVSFIVYPFRKSL